MRDMRDYLIWLNQFIYEMGQMEEDRYWVPYARGILVAVKTMHGDAAERDLLGMLDEWQRERVKTWSQVTHG